MTNTITVPENIVIELLNFEPAFDMEVEFDEDGVMNVTLPFAFIAQANAIIRFAEVEEE